MHIPRYGLRHTLRLFSTLHVRQHLSRPTNLYLARDPERLNIRHKRVFSSKASSQRLLSKGVPDVQMMVQNYLRVLADAISDISGYADWEAIQDEIKRLENNLSDEKLWLNDGSGALKINEQLAHLQKQIVTYDGLVTDVSEMQELATIANEAQDAQMLEDLVDELETVRHRAEKYLLSLRLSEPTDPNPAYIDVRAGSGGAEACDWAEMLARMYTRWAHCRGYTVQVVSKSPGELAGIKETTLLVKGQYAYGYAQYESGVHRLVRISPFSQTGARHTSFASVRVSPYFEDDGHDIGVELKPSDLRITTMRSQGAGGQHVNKTESAVRVVHIPSGIAVLCQQERSQHKNRTLALALLKSKLYDRELQRRAQSKVDTHNALPENGWGSQIRSYVLQPYQLIKDARSGYEVGSGGAQAVLDGDLDSFMEANLRHFRTKSHSRSR